MFHPLEWLSIAGGWRIHRQDSPSKMIKRQMHGNNSFDVSIRQVLGLKRNLYAVIPAIISVGESAETQGTETQDTEAQKPIPT